ncbi:MAG: hypothetical protein FJ290_09050 [Planctomycetes bacterium]|nr:hypothetical protein [Planctomycetota bacterium]
MRVVLQFAVAVAEYLVGLLVLAYVACTGRRGRAEARAGERGSGPRPRCREETRLKERGVGKPLGARLVAVVGFTALSLSGCTYLRHRGEDAADMFDMGVTWSGKPYLSLHMCLLGLASVGGGEMEGGFAGLGNGAFGSQRHFHRNVGLLTWSRCELAWGDNFDPAKPETIESFEIGPVGWAEKPRRKPPYAFACTKYFHLGFVGLVNNVRFAEIADFLLGWTTFDLCGDDGTPPGSGDWPWQRNQPAQKPDSPSTPSEPRGAEPRYPNP